jgi:hypothetical protein
MKKERKTTFVQIRLTQKEKNKLKTKALALTNGNISKLIISTLRLK